MVSSEQGRSGTATRPVLRRTPQDRERRRDLAEAASGVERFKVLIYLCTAPNADSSAHREACEEYADTFAWAVAGVIEDRTGLLPPNGRDGLATAIERIQAREAGAILTAHRPMISPLPDEYDAIASEVESAGGFLVVTDSDGQTPSPAG